MSDDKSRLLLEKLQKILEKQIELARQGKISDVQALTNGAASLSQKITEKGLLKLPEFENHRLKLQEMYQALCLALSAQKADIAEQLTQIRKGKKTIGAYRTNI